MKKVVCKECGSENIGITEQLSPNDDITIRHYFTDTYESDGGSCYCNDCMEYRDFQVLDVTDNKSDLWRCEVCGSTDVQQRAWVDVNDVKIVRFDDCDRNDYYCNYCEGNHYLMRESGLMKTIEEWFANHLRPDDDEVISGLKRDDFASDEEFNVACKQKWDARDVESKINIWRKLTFDRSN